MAQRLILEITGAASLRFNFIVFSQAEAELRVAQTEFDRQYEITKLLLEGISTAHVNIIVTFLTIYFSSLSLQFGILISG